MSELFGRAFSPATFSLRSNTISTGLTIAAAVTALVPWDRAHASIDVRYAHFVAGFRTEGLRSSHLYALLTSGCDKAPELPDPLLDFLCGAMHPEPALRYTLEQLIAHPWLTA